MLPYIHEIAILGEPKHHLTQTMLPHPCQARQRVKVTVLLPALNDLFRKIQVMRKIQNRR